MDQGECIHELAEAIRHTLTFCDPPKEIQPGIYAGQNLPGLLSEALIRVAIENGSAHRLVCHRPGCWEAQHVLALAASLELPGDREEEDVVHEAE